MVVQPSTNCISQDQSYARGRKSKEYAFVIIGQVRELVIISRNKEVPRHTQQDVSKAFEVRSSQKRARSI